jgi:RNA polymerase sigma-70 factor (ECF subfamily)
VSVESAPSRLIEQARNAEPGILDCLLESFRNYLRLLARASIEPALRQDAAVSDVVQDTLLRAWEHFDQFQGSTEAELAGWLRRILLNHLVDLTRRRPEARGMGRRLSLEEMVDRSSEALTKILADDSSSPSQKAERRDLAVVLADALEELSPDHRDVIVLHDLEQLDWDEVARRTGRTPGAARMLWARALTRLRPLIEKKLGRPLTAP